MRKGVSRLNKQANKQVYLGKRDNVRGSVWGRGGRGAGGGGGE